MDQAMRDCSYAHPYERKGEYFASHKGSGSGSCSAFLERRLPSKADGQKTAAKVRVADFADLHPALANRRERRRADLRTQRREWPLRTLS